MKVESFSVRVGSSMYESGGQIVNVSRIVVHPKYSPQTTDYDICLLQLSESLKFTAKIRPIILPNANTVIADGALCTTSGWGKMSLHHFSHRHKICF